MLLVIVGHVPRATVEHAVARTLGQLPHGDYTWRPPARPVDRSTSMTTVARPLSTNYLLGYFHGPSITSPEYPAFVIATQLLSARLMQSIRFTRGLSYAPYADADTAALVTGSVHVSTDSPDQVIPLIREQIQRCRDQWPTQVLVNRIAEHYITVYLMQNETNEAQAASLAQAQIYHGDWHLASATMDALRHVTSSDVIHVSQRYMHDIQFAYLGNVERVRGVRVTGM
jgi:predicted Zn-dependent peptidase